MSDVAQGPGWWIASDGRWYPPELHPSVRQDVQLATGQDVQLTGQDVQLPTDPDVQLATGPEESAAAAAPGIAPASSPYPFATIPPIPVPGVAPTTWDATAAPTSGPPLAVGAPPAGTGPVATPAFASLPQPLPPGAYRTALPPPVVRPRGRRPAVVAAAIVLAVAVIAAGTIVTVLVLRAPSDWVDASLHVVGSPGLVGNAVVVLDVTPARGLEQSGVDPATGAVLWHHPYSASAITAGVAMGPTSVGDIVLQLAPASSPTNPLVNVEGVDADTGVVLWTLGQSVIATDAPAVCGGGRLFCLAVAAADGETGLLFVDPASGGVQGSVIGPMRNMTVPPPGAENAGDLWQTFDPTPTLMQVGSAGQALWSKTVSSLFGSGYDPDDGWDFQVRPGDLDVGSIGPVPAGDVQPVQKSKTIAIDGATGSVVWSTPGEYDCGGPLVVLVDDVVCRYGAVVSPTATPALILAGLDDATGATTWSLPVLDVDALTTGQDLAFSDSTHVVVELRTGQRVVLDSRSGATAPAGPGQVFWCESSPWYKVDAPDASVDGQRQSSPVFQPCSASGVAVHGPVPAGTSTVGVRDSGFFVWPSPQGLRGVASPNSAGS